MSKQPKWNDLIDHAVLVVPAHTDGTGPFEYIVRGVSPSGNNVKMENRVGRTFWCKSGDYLVEEDLGVRAATQTQNGNPGS
jgi:hypothetical protein